ncbi:MAG: sialate O-acetylesterase [Phycisphaerae bacterium]|nr:sialate O-acetylesterase [Phycisphaerae bacterium]MDD5381976.1 sialate O-acetylesterase [Phycisphaerae bacterium]
MNLNARTLGSALCCYVLLICQIAFCNVRLPRLVSDGMVLQRDANVKIWGWADAGEKVTIDFNGKMYSAAADPDGKWTATLSPSKAGGPYNMEIKAANNITLKNILIGDVWVCSGQSNMELTMERVKDKYPNEITNSDNNSIRQFEVPDKYYFDAPHDDLESGTWASANPQTIFKFTAIGYFFAKELYQKYHVPIGLINASLGGSPAQAWMSEDALKAFPEDLATLQKFKDPAYIKQVEDGDKAASDAWYGRLNQTDKGIAPGEKPWFDPTYDASQWATMDVPGHWADGPLGPVKGVVWFRKDINVPASMAGKPARLWLGRIVDGDETYLNGKKVGAITYEWPPRKYKIPADLLKEGKNTIVVRVINCNSWARGGFVTEKLYQLVGAGQTIDLKGMWQYKLGVTMDPIPPTTFVRWQPVGLYNGEIAPLLNYSIKGVIWYQGESNASRNPSAYQKLFYTLIADWRQKWNQGYFPFLYVQLTSFMAAKDQPSESGWAELREAQLKTLAIPNTAMAVTIDIGEWNDIHPLNKEDVGKRLALAAENLAYGEKDVIYSGPIYQSMTTDGNKITLTFTNTDGGLIAKDSNLKYFAIAGADKKFVWANAKIQGDKIIVWNNSVPNPVAVRYAWADNPEGANLYNQTGLPASPFRTDD